MSAALPIELLSIRTGGTRTHNPLICFRISVAVCILNLNYLERTKGYDPSLTQGGNLMHYLLCYVRKSFGFPPGETINWLKLDAILSQSKSLIFNDVCCSHPKLVPKVGLEPTRISPREFGTLVATISTTLALN